MVETCFFTRHWTTFPTEHPPAVGYIPFASSKETSTYLRSAGRLLARQCLLKKLRLFLLYGMERSSASRICRECSCRVLLNASRASSWCLTFFKRPLVVSKMIQRNLSPRVFSSSPPTTTQTWAYSISSKSEFPIDDLSPLRH